MAESDEVITEEVAHYVATVLPRSCKAMHLAFEIALPMEEEGLYMFKPNYKDYKIQKH